MAAALLNVIDCDGYGVRNYFAGRCKDGKYNERNCLYVATKTGEKVILISGGGKAGDEKAIKGQTFGMAYITEVNECCQLFVKEVFDRTLSSANRKVFHDLNPKNPEHWYYTDILDVHMKNASEHENYGFNYGHFTIADNYSISTDRLKQILLTYDKNSIWYKRDILGHRIATQGLIYQQFAENNEMFIEKDLPHNIMIISIGIDYGASKSNTSFKCIGITAGYKDVYVLEEMDMKGVKTPEIVYQHFEAFYRKIIAKYGMVNFAFCDYGALGQVITHGLQEYCFKHSIPLRLHDCEKGKILDRVQLVSFLIASKRYHVMNNCKAMIAALNNALWDDKREDVRLDDGTTDVDSLDAMEYALYPFRAKFIRK